MIIGHQKQRQYLAKLADSGKISHALLFAGQDQLGKKTVALEFAKSLIKEEFRGDQHPDLILVGREAGESEIKIAQIRDLIWKLSLRPYSAPWKIAVLDEADRMTKDAQNCFLKTLEEPTLKTLVILVSSHPNQLLPTILSRCQIVKFYPVPGSEIESYLQKEGLDRVKIEEVSDLAAGRPGRLMEILRDPEKMAEAKAMVKELQEAMVKNLAFRFQLAKTLADRDNFQETLDVWQNFLRKDVIKNANPLKQIQNINYFLLNTNVSPRLALEILMLEI
ncbi:MAG: AAA family ATPase [Candidatus Nealsonbacteria bacterium]|nr:AAA family ATPase [Candidatus Nealsonbacteria bacterium]